MRFESEVVSEELLPAVRSIMASRLDEDYGLNQVEIAEKLDVTQPAVSQYLSGKRADQSIVSKLEDDPQIGLLIKEASDRAARDEIYLEQLRQVVQAVRDKGLMKKSFSEAERIL